MTSFVVINCVTDGPSKTCPQILEPLMSRRTNHRLWPRPLRDKGLYALQCCAVYDLKYTET